EGGAQGTTLLPTHTIEVRSVDHEHDVSLSHRWRMIPTHIGNAHTIYGSFRRWRREGGWARVMDTLRQWERQSQGRLPAPSACCAGSQSIKTATQGTDVGFDGNKQIKGRKRQLLVDTLGLIVAVVVTA